jgi:hypothetical protein
MVSRFKNFHDAAKTMLADGEMSITTRRWFEGDPPPWNGARLKHGALIIDFVDKSGFVTGTSPLGSLFNGIRRGVTEFLEGFVDTQWVSIDEDPSEAKAEYSIQGWLSTNKQLPVVIYRDGETTGIESYKHKQKASKGVQFVVGGHSMPGVNEAIGAVIQGLGDILGDLAQIGSIGGVIDSLAKPIYEDTILAWWAVKSLLRAQDQGWSRYFEYMVDGSSQAYTIASLMAMRQADWLTRARASNEIDVRDGAPWLVGERGLGHFGIGDRIGYTIRNDVMLRVFIEQVSQINLSASRGKAAGFVLKVGRAGDMDDPIAKAFAWLEDSKAAMKDLGVF